MSLIRPALAAALFALASLAAPLAAHAATPVVVVDYQRLFSESAAGKDAQAKLKGIADGITRELAPEEQGLNNDQKSLGPKFQGKTNQQVVDMLKADPNLAAKYDAFMKRGTALTARQELRTREYQATESKALSDVATAAQTVIADVMKSKGASVVFEWGATIAVSKEADITNDVIAGLNKKTSSIAVAKVDLTKQQQAPR